MRFQDIPQDDVQDVIEMTEKLKNSIFDILKDTNTQLAMSALISATINCILAQCETIEQVIKLRNNFIIIFDSTIKNIKVKE
jgi:hypothetical protein